MVLTVLAFASGIGLSRGRFNERLCYWHSILAGLCSLTWFMAADAAVEYGLQVLRR